MTLVEGFFRRILAGILDTWILSLVLGVVLGPLSFVGFMVYTATAIVHPAIMFAVLGVTIVGMIALPAAYYAGFESSSWQSTPGKRMAGLKVTDLEGERPKYWQSFVKTILQEVFYAIFTTGSFVLVSGESFRKANGIGDATSSQPIDITPVLLAIVLSQGLFAVLFVVPWFRNNSQTLVDKWTSRSVVLSKERIDAVYSDTALTGPRSTIRVFWQSPILSMSIMLVTLMTSQFLLRAADITRTFPKLEFLQDDRALWVTGGLLSILTVYGFIGFLQEIFLHSHMQGLSADGYVKTAKFLSSISIGLKRDLFDDFSRAITRAYEGNAAEAFRLIEPWEKRLYVTPMYYATAVFAGLLLDDDDHIVQVCQEAIKKMPRQCDYYRIQIAHVYFRRRQFTEGIEVLEPLAVPKTRTGLAILQMAFMACFARVGALDELNKTEELIRAFRKDSIPDFCHDYYQGIALASRGDYREAKELLDAASRLIPEGSYMSYLEYSNRAFKNRIRDCRQFMLSVPAAEAKADEQVVKRLVSCANRLGIFKA